MHKLLQDYSKKPVIPTGRVNGLMAKTFDNDYSSSDSEENIAYPCENYEQEYVNNEIKRYGKPLKDNDDDSQSMCNVEGMDDINLNASLDVYAQYKFDNPSIRKELPIDSLKDRIVNLVEANNVVIIKGPTGCGKTTQVPQYILDYCRERSEYCNIAVTQPRKIATINIAKRVCEERGWALGSVCGYQVGLEKKVSPSVILTYMTTGILLQKLICAKTLRQFTHIIIDEVHERNQDLDFLLLIVRRFLFTNSPKTKVILMSATIEAENFAYYFRRHNYSSHFQAPVIKVDKRSNFSKSIFYLENLSSAMHSTSVAISEFDINVPLISEGIWTMFTFLIGIMDKLDVIDPVTNKVVIGTVLVFLPGLNEIEEAQKRLLLHKQTGSSKTMTDWDIIPLHSSLPNDEQAKAFRRAEGGVRKIILSTNIAESSITVPDSYYVIDFCQTKVMTLDPLTKYSSLKLEWASHVNCEQRAGRVGRIGNGRVYRLVPINFYKNKMSAKSIPEILRAPLEKVVLQAKQLDLNDTPQQILALAMNPPNLRNIETTILTLKEMGALLRTCRGTISSHDGDITFLGTVMASLPIDVHLSKLIILGHFFGCLQEAMIIAAGCSIQNIFSIPFQQRFEAYKKLWFWADGSSSDLIALLNLFQVWLTYKRDNSLSNERKERTWCKDNLVNVKGLREWNLLVTEIQQRLDFLNVKATNVTLSASEKPLILKIIMAGAFYPNYFVTLPESKVMDEREAVKTLAGRDPYRSVYFTGMDPSQPGPLYVRQIKAMLQDGDLEKDFAVGFDGSSKVYIEFKRVNESQELLRINVGGHQKLTDSIRRKIATEVYQSIRKRQLKYNFELKILPSHEAWSWAEKKGIKRSVPLQNLTVLNEEKNSFSEINYSPIPTLDTQFITLKVTEFVDASFFWANVLESEKYLGKIEEILNKQVLHPVLSKGEEIILGKVYAARFYEDNLFYRCKVVSMQNKKYLQVLFIDYGNSEQIAPSELYILPDRPECKIAPLALECVLHGIQPSKKTNPKGIWIDSVNNYWKKKVMGVLLHGEVHSVVDNVVNVVLYQSSPQNRQVKSLNTLMIENGVAEPAFESYFSKVDHEKRQKVQMAENPNAEANRLCGDRVTNYSDFETPQISNVCHALQLKGPFSPLEMRIYGVIASGLNKAVDIEGTSVNSVLLDTELEDYHTRLIISGHVAQSPSGERLKLRQTTVMPNIPGLPMLMALLFSPVVQVKVTEDCDKVGSILCGLGVNGITGKALYPSHDMVLVLDTELTEDEVNKINQIRFYMNQGLKVMNDIALNNSNQDEMIRTQNALKQGLSQLIYMPRKRTERKCVTYASTWGDCNADVVELKPSMVDSNDDIWPLLWFVKLNKIDDYSRDVKKNLEDMYSMAMSLFPAVETYCILCEKPLFTLANVRFHLISEKHKAEVERFHENLENGSDADDEEC